MNSHEVHHSRALIPFTDQQIQAAYAIFCIKENLNQSVEGLKLFKAAVKYREQPDSDKPFSVKGAWFPIDAAGTPMMRTEGNVWVSYTQPSIKFITDITTAYQEGLNATTDDTRYRKGTSEYDAWILGKLYSTRCNPSPAYVVMSIVNAYKFGFDNVNNPDAVNLFKENTLEYIAYNSGRDHGLRQK